MFQFSLTAKNNRARTGIFSTPHGDLLTPVFAPVGTQATVKGLTQRDLAEDLDVEVAADHLRQVRVVDGAIADIEDSLCHGCIVCNRRAPATGSSARKREPRSTDEVVARYAGFQVTTACARDR